MEDEECLPENGSLKLYLENLGFSDLQITKAASQNLSSIRFAVTKPTSKLPYVETIDEDVVEQINIIISTQMLFEEDISNVEKLLSNFKVVKNGLLKSMFKDFFGIAVIFLGLCLFWVIGHYAFFIVSSFYAFSAANYLKKKRSYKNRLEKLMSILEANFLLLKKAVKFIEENRLIESNSTSAKISEEFIEGFAFYNNFKSDFTESINEIINILILSTQKLINKIPLHDYIENPDYYLCNNFNKDYSSANLIKLYEIYFLVQSEFLQRLILSLIPNIKLSTTDGFCELNKILTETCINLLKIKHKLSKKFKFIFLNGIHLPKNKAELKLPLKSKKSENNYLKEVVWNIHETSKSFQSLLIKCRMLEENLILEAIPLNIEEELVKIQASLNMCQKNISDSFILFKKANSVTENADNLNKIKLQDKELNSLEKVNKIMVGYTDLDPKIEDEIFEAYFTSEDSNRNLSDVYDFNFKLEKKQEREYCKNVMKELKLKLVEKAKHWRQREKELLKKKGIIDKEETESSDEEKKVELKTEKSVFQNISSNEEKMPFKCEKFVQTSGKIDFEATKESEKNENKEKYETKSYLLGEMFTTISRAENQDSEKNNVDGTHFETGNIQNLNSETENINKTFYQGFNSGFLFDLSQARQKIFKSSALKEQLFYASGEDSSSEEGVT